MPYTGNDKRQSTRRAAIRRRMERSNDVKRARGSQTANLMENWAAIVANNRHLRNERKNQQTARRNRSTTYRNQAVLSQTRRKPRIQEDSPSWNALTMGNRVSGAGPHPPKGVRPGPVMTRDNTNYQLKASSRGPFGPNRRRNRFS